MHSFDMTAKIERRASNEHTLEPIFIIKRSQSSVASTMKSFLGKNTVFSFQLAVIYKSCSENGGCHVAMFSTTMAPDVEQWCKLNLDNPVRSSVKNHFILAELSRRETVLQTLFYKPFREPS